MNIGITNPRNEISTWLVKKKKKKKKLILFTINQRYLKQYVLKHLQKHDHKFAVYTDRSKSKLGLGLILVGNNLKIEYSLPPLLLFMLYNYMP